MPPRFNGARRTRSPNDTDRAVGVKLRKLRTDAGLTLQSLGEQIGVSHQQLQKYETGANRISAGMLPAIADALGVDMMDFFEMAMAPDAHEMSEADQLRRECERLLRRTKSAEDLRAMAKVMKALAK